MSVFLNVVFHKSRGHGERAFHVLGTPSHCSFLIPSGEELLYATHWSLRIKSHILYIFHHPLKRWHMGCNSTKHSHWIMSSFLLDLTDQRCTSKFCAGKSFSRYMRPNLDQDHNTQIEHLLLPSTHQFSNQKQPYG